MSSILVRRAETSEALAIARLMGELGYPMGEEVALERLRTLAGRDGTRVLVAVDGDGVVAVAGTHLIPLLHHPGSVGRLIAFVVSSEHRGRGVGSLLLSAAEEVLWSQGCERIEVTSGDQRADAHRFYLRAGYRMQSRRFLKRRDPARQP